MEVCRMRWLRKKYLLVTVGALLALAMACLISGCQGVSAREVLDNSGKTMAQITTAEMQMESSGTINGQSIETSGDIEEVASGSEGTKLKMTMQVAGQTMEVYMVGGTNYVATMGRWFRTSSPVSDVGPIGLGSLKDIESEMSNANNPKIITEDSQSFTIAFSLRPDYLQNKLNEYKARNSNLASTSQVTSNEITVKIDKSTKRATEETINMTIHTSQFGDGKSESHVKMIGYNIPIKIEVPPEALNAPELPSGLTP